jgi:signal transduction histidine kinase
MENAKVAWLTAGVAALAGLWAMGLALPPDPRKADSSGLLLALFWFGSPYVAFARLAYAWRRYRVASWSLLAITTAVAIPATWAYSQLFQPGNAASLGAASLPLYQWGVVAAILAGWLLVGMSRMFGGRQPPQVDPPDAYRMKSSHVWRDE